MAADKKKLTKDFLPYLPGLLVLILSLITSFLLDRNLKNYDRERFSSTQEVIEQQITSRLHSYIQSLNQTRNMFVIRPDISREDFRRYIAKLDILQKYPGIQGIGYAPLVSFEGIKKLEEKARREGVKNFTVWPDFPRKEHFTILYLEPMDWRNERALGYDMFTEPIRKKVMELARDTGKTAMTDTVELVQETETDKQKGFLLYSPIIREEKLIGFIYAPFRAGDLFREIMRTMRNSYVGIEVYMDDGIQLFTTNGSTEKSVFSSRSKLNLAQKTWDLYVYALPGFRSILNTILPWVLLLLGILISALITLILRRNVHHARMMEALYADAQKAIATRDEFLSIASHELKTPVTSMRLQFQVAERMINKNDPAVYEKSSVERRVSTAIRQLERMNKLIEDMLEVTRISHGKLSIEKRPFDLCRLLHGVADRFTEQLKSQEIQLKVSVPSSEIIITGDEFRIEQVISNLINNAIKYGEKKPIAVTLERQDQFAILCFQDHGMGISEERLPFIFGRFERAVPHGNYSGLGLGLYICKKIIEAHDGTITAQSKLGKGSVFMVKLPLRTSLPETLLSDSRSS